MVIPWLCSVWVNIWCHCCGVLACWSAMCWLVAMAWASCVCAGFIFIFIVFVFGWFLVVVFEVLAVVFELGECAELSADEAELAVF